MPTGFRGALIRGITFVGGLYFFLVYVLPKHVSLGEFGPYEVGKYYKEVIKALTVVGVMAFGLAIINILMVHGPRVVKMHKHWRQSSALLLGLTVTLVINFYDFYLKESRAYEKQVRSGWVKYSQSSSPTNATASTGTTPPVEEIRQRIGTLQKAISLSLTRTPPGDEEVRRAVERWDVLSGTLTTSPHTLSPEELQQQWGQVPDVLTSLTQALNAAEEKKDVRAATVSRISEFIQNAFFVPLGAAMFSLLAFYIVNAAYRAFRIRSVEAAVMMSAAVLVMLGQIPYGPMYVHPSLPQVRLWLIETVSTPVFRAITFGSIIAGLAMAIRIWLSLDYYAGRKSRAADTTGGNR